MCEESLPPEYFEMFEKVKAKLFKNRKDLHFSDCALHNEPESPNGECDCKTDEKVVTEDVRWVNVDELAKEYAFSVDSEHVAELNLIQGFKAGWDAHIDFAQSQHK